MCTSLFHSAWALEIRKDGILNISYAKRTHTNSQRTMYNVVRQKNYDIVDGRKFKTQTICLFIESFILNGRRLFNPRTTLISLQKNE